MDLQYSKRTEGREPRWKEKIARYLLKPPFKDDVGQKGWARFFSDARETRVSEYKVKLPGWPVGTNLRIAFFSDLHVGSHNNDLRRLENIVTQVNSLKPDIILLGGDYMNMTPFLGGHVSPKAIAQVLDKLEASLGVFAVMGNHDAEYGFDEIRLAFADVNIKFLENAFGYFEFSDSYFFLAGLEDEQTGKPDMKGIMQQVSSDMPGLIVAHDPASFMYLKRTNCLMLCGHTHGGQVDFPYLGPLYNSSKAPLEWTYGHIRYAGRQMVVSSGIGTGIPLRIGTWPEVCLIECNGAIY